MIKNCKIGTKRLRMVGFIAATILMACVYSQVAAQEQNETVKYVNFTEETSKGKFIGCQILFKILSRVTCTAPAIWLP
jgi:hypothetical protein